MRKNKIIKLIKIILLIMISIFCMSENIIVNADETIVTSLYSSPREDITETLGSSVLLTSTVEQIDTNLQMTRTKDEIREKYKSAICTFTDENAFLVEPVSVGPNYKEGTLSTIAKEETLDWINYYRYLFGVNDIKINSDTMEFNGAGAVLLKVSDEITHSPSKPSDMSTEFYKKAIQGTKYPDNFGDYGNFASGNIAAGATLPQSIDDWVSDISSSSGLVEHRYSLLSPNAVSTSFGYAPGQGKVYSNFTTLTMFESYNVSTNNFHTWPAAGYSPVEISDYRQKWSVTFDSEFSVTPSYSSGDVYYLSTDSTKINLVHNNVTYTVENEIIYNKDYNSISFDIPQGLKDAIKGNSTIMYNPGEKVEVVIESSNISKNSNNVKISYWVEFFEAAEEEYVPVQSVSFDSTDITIALGKELTLTAKITPSNATVQDITWTSSNEEVVTVDENGKITTLTTGQTIIRATVEDKYAEVLVNVYREVEALYADQVRYELLVGETANITYKIVPEDATYRSVTFESSNEEVATVSSTGVITAVSCGEADITIMSSNVKVTAKVIVSVLNEKIPITSMEFEQEVYNVYTGYYKQLNLIFGPEEANSGKIITYASSDESVAKVDQYGYLKTYNEGVATITAINQDGIQAECVVNVTLQTTSLKYQTHIQNIGWQKFVENGELSGTSGRGFRLEGIILDLDTTLEGNIEYTTHVQNIGWQNYVQDEELSGTSGRGLRLEGIKIRLTGEVAEYYDVYYRVHIQNSGWLAWAKNDEIAGSSGYGFRLEAIQIALVPKGDPEPELDPVTNKTKCFMEKVNIIYQTHIQNVGWQANVRNGATSGTPGEHLRIESLKLKIESTTSGSIRYSTHVQNIGWTDFVEAGKNSGTVGRGLRLEAVKIELTGELAEKYDIYYRIYVEGKDEWLDWAKNGEEAGSTGYGMKLEGMQVVIKTKGAAAPGATDNPCWNKE